MALEVETLYWSLREGVALIWGGGIAALLATLVALASRRLAWPSALALMMGIFSLGTGAYLLVWGNRHCVHSFSSGGVSPEGAKYGYSLCLEWASSPWAAGLGMGTLAGAALALLAALGPGPARQRGLLLLAAGVLTLPNIALGMSPASLLIGLLPPATLLALGIRQRRLHELPQG